MYIKYDKGTKRVRKNRYASRFSSKSVKEVSTGILLDTEDEAYSRLENFEN